MGRTTRASTGPGRSVGIDVAEATPEVGVEPDGIGEPMARLRAEPVGRIVPEATGGCE